MTIIIVEDTQKLREELSIYLEKNGFKTIQIIDFTNVKEQIINAKEKDLILLDINLPNLDGEYLLKDLRKEIDTPIIIVTSKNTETDELLCIEYGADDFITKPFSPRILLARITRLLERNTKVQKEITYKDMTINITKSQIERNNKKIDLSKNELKILIYLLNNQGTIVTRDDIISYLWDNNEYVDDNTLTVNINRVRSKLEKLDLENVILTQRGQGYIILWI